MSDVCGRRWVMNLDEQIEHAEGMCRLFPNVDGASHYILASLRELKRLRECVKEAGPHGSECEIQIKPWDYDGDPMDYCNCWKRDALKGSADGQ